MITTIQAQQLKNKTISDGNGLYLRALPSGTKQWILKKRVGGRFFTKTIGNFPVMSVAVARKTAADYLDKIAPDPNKKIMLFNDVFTEWFKLKQIEVKDYDRIKMRLKPVLRRFGSLPYESVTTLDISSFVRKFTHDGSQKLETAKRIALYIKQLETFAVNSGFTDRFKFQGIGQTIPRPKVQSRLSIHPDYLPEILQKMKLESVASPMMWPLFLFGLYSLLRPNEYCALRWEWIKDEVISIPTEVMKMRRPFQVPITRQIKEILTAQHARKIGDYVFYSPLHPDKPYNLGSYEIFLRKHGFKGILVPHGLRSIGRTWMAENGARHDVAEMCLAHQVGNAVEMAYNRANLLKMRLETMQQWNDFVDECLAVEIKGKGHYFDF